MAFLFPFTSLYEVNLDWILSEVKKFSELIPPMESAVDNVQTALESAETALEDAEDALEMAGDAKDIAQDAKDIAEQAAQGVIADGAVTTPKIADGAVTPAKLDAAILAYLNKYNIIHVNPNGTADHTTIQAAVAAASDGDIIIVHTGTYTESVKATNKKVYIIGVDRETCILTYSGLDYANPPLEMAKGGVSNLTIKCTNTGTPGLNNAYCAHIDSDQSADETLTFTNVTFDNPVHQAVGIGLRHNFTLTFRNCTFIADDQAAFYCHDWETNNALADKTGQKVALHDCILVNNSASHATIMLQSQELATDCATFLITGCSAINNDVAGSKISMSLWQSRTLTNNSYLGSSDWVLDSSSSLNTILEANATKTFVTVQHTFNAGAVNITTLGARFAQLSIADPRPDLTLIAMALVSVQNSTAYSNEIIYANGMIYLNYYGAQTGTTNQTNVVVRLTYL